MAYIISETDEGTFRCENDETGATGYGETPEEALEALCVGEDGGAEELDEDDVTAAYDNGYSDGFRSGFLAAKEAVHVTVEDLEPEDFEG